MQKFTWLILFLLITNRVSAQKENIEVFKYVEHMPEPGYNVNQYLAANLHYPDTAIKNNIHGLITVQFVVMDNGSIDSVKIAGKNRFGYGLEEEAVRVVTTMPAWKPGEQNGKPVKVYYFLPILFKIKEEERKGTEDTVYKYAEVMPEPEYNLHNYIATHIEYPVEALQRSIQGKVKVKFIINEKGLIEKATVIPPELGGGCDEEALRLVNSFPAWKPGKQNGKPVKVYFIQPISFSLDNAAERAKNAAGH